MTLVTGASGSLAAAGGGGRFRYVRENDHTSIVSPLLYIKSIGKVDLQLSGSTSEGKPDVAAVPLVSAHERRRS